MAKYIIKRLFMMIAVTLGVMLFVFFFQSVSPDDPTAAILGEGATDEQRMALRAELGLDDPVIVQFARYVWNFMTKGDLGTSYKSNQPVIDELLARFPVTFELAIGSVLLGVIIGVPLGVLSAVKEYSVFDSVILAFSVFARSMPTFWLGLIMISLFSVKLGWLPSYGIMSWKGWVMPTIVVCVATMSSLVRTTRSSMLEVIRQDYIRTARAKGQTERKIIIRHALRNSMIPIVNTIGNTMGIQLGGALVIESVFGMPGIGKYAVDAISARNYPAVTGSVVFLAIVFSVVNLIVDISYTAIDPRLRSSIIGENRKKSRRTRQIQEG